MHDLIKSGYPFITWYTDAHQQIIELSNRTGWPADRIALVLAGLSPRVQLVRNVRLAIYYLRYREFHPTTLCSSRVAVLDGLANGRLRGIKTEPFRRALLGDLSQLVVDTWICRAFGVDQRKLNRATIAFIRARLIPYCAAYALPVASIQAAVWKGTIERHNRSAGWFPIISEF